MNTFKITTSLHDQAASLALKGDWKAAIAVNEQILALNNKSTESLLRLGFAYLQLNQIIKSKKAYLKALKIQPANQIAKNNLQKIAILEKKKIDFSPVNKMSNQLNPNLFLHVAGKTRVVPLINIGQADILAKLKIGQKVTFKIKKRRVEVRTDENEYVGALPDDISKRLAYFLEAGSQYSTFIKEASKNTVDVFVREEKKGRSVAKYLSFPKNIQDSLKNMIDDEDKTDDESEAVDEDVLEETESPVDLEELAEAIEDTDTYAEGHNEDDDEEQE
ncbi:hypothetical protein A3C23_01110 [Candidatus Roizmanbacteria bacterium RIFCSPHIGHO2_02_FULL_37_13b]|uniref:Uncharacterized protein n=1 Tax=Candidatus Roizmanbacteria bacterium RIFCSPLOWO2_02_FULL_36_11 TaxID=1802071 RepID=A0A1F7JIT1_9BACT|nr:MAG: hypothetical protein A3C23_01110 [Candidatus Roizmanbacteria bacterium RIFCSPHIGHO2_02_FULL_37_13b]OGK55509.1 MAG: hypothetical protein A3H78_05075 [Candidatus Roizmanbacteria bacterium RIFCSPLOWO2_02_FULL_36_11]